MNFANDERDRKRWRKAGKYRIAKCLCIAMISGVIVGSAAANGLAGQPQGINYDESKVPPYALPDPLVMESGEQVATARMWMEQRRPELLKLFQEYEYGRSPGRPTDMAFHVNSVDQDALGGKTVRKEVTISFTRRKNGPRLHLLIYIPKNAPRPVSVFLGLNFHGNQAISLDPGVPISQAWMRGGTWGVVNHRATAATRGLEECYWQLPMILARGYGLATIYYGDIEPDLDGGWRQGVRGFYLRPGQKEPAPGDWGAIGVWAWGLSRAMDYLETDKDVDAHRVAVVGHSRLGKTALWAGARDERFALVISNESGEGGAKLSRHWFGETVRSINASFPWWFCAKFKKFNDNVDALPVDQHELIALVAPRPVYIATAAGDLWEDPKGSFLAAKAAAPVYRLLGAGGFGADAMPGIDQPVVSRISFHLRCGPHSVTAYDWEQFLNFADKYVKARPLSAGQD